MKLKKILLIILTVWIIITAVGGIYLHKTIPSRENEKVTTLKNGVRLAFFSDVHIQNSEQEVQTDIGAPSSEISKNGKIALNSVNPDYILSTGDLTTHTEPDEWIGYKKWIDDLNAPVFDILGNHDRDHFPNRGTYGTEYFTELGRVSGTKVLKLGNNVFILISEEHNPEFDNNNLASTIPQKRFEFIEKYLKKYSENNNIFVINHVPLSGTTAFSKTWFYGNNKNWVQITNKFMTLFEKYDVVAHISGHIHTDYRWKDEPRDQDGTTGVENIGKFISGKEITNSTRLHPPYRLPNTYFLNMPALDFAHGWLSRFHFIASPNGNPTTKTSNGKGSPYAKFEEIGPPLTDILHSAETSSFLGRAGIYYTNFLENREKIKIITRWVSGNTDVEEFEIELNHAIKLENRKIHFIASDLSLREKDNLMITRDNWFKTRKGESGVGTFSKKYRKKHLIEGVSIDNHDLKSFDIKWMGSTNSGENWQENWYDNPENMGEINAVKIKIRFIPETKEKAHIEDIEIRKSPDK